MTPTPLWCRNRYRRCLHTFGSECVYRRYECMLGIWTDWVRCLEMCTSMHSTWEECLVRIMLRFDWVCCSAVHHIYDWEPEVYVVADTTWWKTQYIWLCWWVRVMDRTKIVDLCTRDYSDPFCWTTSTLLLMSGQIPTLSSHVRGREYMHRRYDWHAWDANKLSEVSWKVYTNAQHMIRKSSLCQVEVWLNCVSVQCTTYAIGSQCSVNRALSNRAFLDYLFVR